MKPRLSILVQVGGLAVAAVIAAQAIALAVFLSRPPPVPQMRPSQALDALRDAAGAGKAGMQREVGVNRLPEGAMKGSDLLLAIALAGALDRPVRDVVVRTLDPTGRSDQVSSVALSLSQTGAEGYPISRIDNVEKLPPDLLKLISGTYMASDAEQPAFEVALRSGSEWITVRPATSWLTLWRSRVLLMLGASLLLLAPLVWWVARRITLPVRALADAARRVGAVEDGEVSFPIGGPSEIADTAEALNGMQARLSAHLAQRLRMLTAVAHDLRTPLTGLRLRVEGVSGSEGERMVADIHRMETMISEVLAFSAANRNAEPAERTELRALVADCIEAGMYESQVLLEDGAPVHCSVGPIRLGRAVGNLLDNAMKYAGAAKVVVTAEGDAAVIEVIDDGPGVPEAELLAVVEPFYRAEGSRSRQTGGIGLGLAIARESVERDGGELSLCNHAPHGLVVRIRLPVLR